MSGRDLHIDGVFELHRRGSEPSQRLLVVFSAANAKSFTFFRNTSEMRPDVLYVRDPVGNAWFQEGLAPGETLDDIEARIASVAGSYREIWMLGSSMGGYGALYFGSRLNARRILALSPQIVVDSRFSRGPRNGTKVQTPDISDLVRAATRSQITIVFGSLDLIDAYNISRLYRGPDVPMHFRVVQYDGQDHMLPIRIEAQCTLKHFFQSILSRNTIPQTGLSFTEGAPLPPARLAILEGYVDRLLEGDHAAAHEEISRVAKDHADWVPLRFLEIETAMAAGLPLGPYLGPAQDLAAGNETAIDYAFLVAQVAEALGEDGIARDYLRRVFAIRTSHPPGRRMLARIEERAPEEVAETQPEDDSDPVELPPSAATGT